MRRCVVFLGYQDANRIPHVIGSAFWIVDTRYGYGPACLITASHVLNDIEKMGGDAVSMRFNYKDGNARWLSVSLSRWRAHPCKNVDVAYLRIPIESEMDHAGCPTGMFETEKSSEQDKKSLDIGDEVFFMGMFWPHHGTSRNIPVVRVGNVASVREEHVDTQHGPMDLYLVEARSIGGLSGSPVFLDIVKSKLEKEWGTIPLIHRFRMVGMINGHFKGPEREVDARSLSSAEVERLNMGIAFMTPSEVILEGLNMFKEEDLKAEEEAKSRGRKLAIDDAPRSDVAIQVTRLGAEINKK